MREEAEKEIIDLVLNDRLVRTTLQQCRIEDAEIRSAFQSFERFDQYIKALVDTSVEAGKVHDDWSAFLANRGFIIKEGDSIERCCATLEETFRCGL